MYSGSVISTSAFSNQNRMPISRCIVVAEVRLPVLALTAALVEPAEGGVAVGDERAHAAWLGEGQRLAVVGLASPRVEARSVRNRRRSTVRPRDGDGAVGRRAAPASNVRAAVLVELWRDQLIAEALVVPLAVIVRDKLVDGVAQTSLSEENDPIETLFADRAHEPFRVALAFGA